MGLDRRTFARGVRPPRDRKHAAGVPSDRDPPPAVVERDAVCPPLGPAGRQPERTAPPRGRPRALGRLQPIVRAAVRLAAEGCARNRDRPAARIDPAARGRRASSSVSEVDLGTDCRSRVHQLVCSPYRNPLSPKERRIVRATSSRLGERLFGALARLAGVTPPSASWHAVRAATFDNSVGELLLDGRAATAMFRRSPREREDPERLIEDRPLQLAS